MVSAADDILDFWFVKSTPEDWFKKNDGFDATIRERFGALVEDAAAARLDGWRGSADGCLALILLLDQFTRNIHRGSPQAFAADHLALDYARHALNQGYDRAVAAERRPFYYLPFEHSEDLADQERSVRLFEAHGDPVMLDYAIRHKVIVERFGRFPHRNAVLGRASTPEELEFLAGPNSSF